MAYVAEHLQLDVSGMSNTGNRQWTLNTTDAIATVNTANYVSDGVSRGMNQGDLVWVKQRASLPSGDVSAVSLCFVNNVGTGSDGLGVDLTDGLTVTATDTD